MLIRIFLYNDSTDSHPTPKPLEGFMEDDLLLNISIDKYVKNFHNTYTMHILHKQPLPSGFSTATDNFMVSSSFPLNNVSWKISTTLH